MEEEVKTNFFTKAFAWIKKNWIIVASVVAVIVVAIVLLCIFGGGPKKAVKQFVSGMNNKKVSKAIKSMDFVGMKAWGYYYDEEDFSEEDYKEFIESYKEVDKKDIENSMDYFEELLDDEFEEMEEDYKKFKIKIEEIKSVEKLGKDLYVVKAKIATYAKPKDKDKTEEVDESNINSFVVYKNKLISIDSIL